MIKEYGYEYDAILNRKLWAETQGKVTSEKWNGAYCLRSGRDALKAIAREFEPCEVFLPALSCDSMVFPFEIYGHHVRFYKLKENYSVDMENLTQMLGCGTGIFLYMDYFSCPAITDSELEKLRRKGLIIIEDRTHNLLEKRQSAFSPDYTIASIRKWLAVPDGGLLWGKITKEFGDDTSFAEKRLKAQLMRHDFLQSGKQEIKTEYRKIFSTVSNLMDIDQPKAMSAYSYALIKETDWNQLMLQRKKNAEVLSQILSSYSFSKSYFYVPFLIENRDTIQESLSSMGIFNTIIWPLTDRQRKACETAKYTESHMLAAPCDQRFTEADMEYIGKEIVRVIENG